MPASVGDKRPLCSWHAACSTSSVGRMADDFDEFERWCTALLEASYCCLWTHYPVVALWNSVQGRPVLADQPSARACASTSCSEAVDVKPDHRPLRERIEGLKGAIGQGEAQPVGELVPAWVTEA